MNKHSILSRLALLAVAAFAAFSLAGCGKPEPPPQPTVEFDTLETARAQARSNADYNAKAYRANNPSARGMDLFAQGDSTQTAVCPQGDGWASVHLVKLHPTDGETRVKLKCSTTSAAVGCMTDEEFKSKPFADEDNRCAPTTRVPFPIRKIGE